MLCNALEALSWPCADGRMGIGGVGGPYDMLTAAAVILLMFGTIMFLEWIGVIARIRN